MGNEAIDYINRDIVSVKKELETLSKIVHLGNGKPSLVQQVSELSNNLNHLQLDIKKDLGIIQDKMDEARAVAEQKASNSWQFKTAMIVALISSATSIYLGWKQPDASQDSIQEHAMYKALNNKIDKLMIDRIASAPDKAITIDKK